MADVNRQLEAALAAHEEAVGCVAGLAEPIARAVEALIAALDAGAPVLLCGNGGSAADAQHLAAELVGRFARERRALPAQALTVNTSVLTAVGNDYGFNDVFARQVAAFGAPGGVLVALSTSGESENVSRAMDAARDAGMVTVALTGRDGGAVGRAADVHLNIPAGDTARVQEAHILIGHVICALVEETVCERP